MKLWCVAWRFWELEEGGVELGSAGCRGRDARGESSCRDALGARESRRAEMDWCDGQLWALERPGVKCTTST